MNDPRYGAAVKLRSEGRAPAAANLLSDLLRTCESRTGPCEDAGVYLEYGMALRQCASEAADLPPPPASKRAHDDEEETANKRAALCADDDRKPAARRAAADDDRKPAARGDACCEEEEPQLESAVAAEGWHSAGPHVGSWVTRSVGGEGAHSVGRVVGYLAASESDFFDASGAAAPLWRVRFVDGELAGDAEDLEEAEVLASAPRATREMPPQQQEETAPASAWDSGSGDLKFAWDMLNHARELYLRGGEGAREGVARCCAALGDVDLDAGEWADAIVEFAQVVGHYEAAPPRDLEQELRLVSALASQALAYAEHSFDAPEADVFVCDAVIAPAADKVRRALDYVERAERLADAVLTRLASEPQVDDARKRIICAHVMELQNAKNRALQLPR